MLHFWLDMVKEDVQFFLYYVRTYIYKKLDSTLKMEKTLLKEIIYGISIVCTVRYRYGIITFFIIYLWLQIYTHR